MPPFLIEARMSVEVWYALFFAWGVLCAVVAIIGLRG